MLACSTSLLYNISNIYRREREKAEKEEKAPLIPERQEKTPGFTVPGAAAGDGGDGGDGNTEYWRFNDAMNALLTCCALGILLLSSSILGQVNFAKVAEAYAPKVEAVFDARL